MRKAGNAWREKADKNPQSHTSQQKPEKSEKEKIDQNTRKGYR